MRFVKVCFMGNQFANDTIDAMAVKRLEYSDIAFGPGDSRVGRRMSWGLGAARGVRAAHAGPGRPRVSLRDCPHAVEYCGMGGCFCILIERYEICNSLFDKLQ